MKNKFLVVSLLLPLTALFSQVFARELTSAVALECCNSMTNTCDFYNCGLGNWGGHPEKTITSIASGAFLGFSNIQTINLMGAQISDLEEGDFYGLPNLTSLDLSLNEIVSIESGDFKGLSKLATLNLGGNKITNIDKSDFSFLPKLATLNLAGNPLEAIESGTFEAIPLLSSLNISNTCTNTQFNISFVNYHCSDGISADQSTCENKYVCSDEISQNQLTCENTYYCTDGISKISGLTNQTDCENAGTCSDGFSPNQLICESGGYCDDGVSPDQSTCEEQGYMWNPNFRIGGVYMWTAGTWQSAGYTWIESTINASTDNNSCSIISSNNQSDFITALTDRSYSVGGSLVSLSGTYYVGSAPLSFNAGVTNQILANTIMASENGGTVEVQYDQGTAITTTGGRSFTGILEAPFIYGANDNVKILRDITSVMKFGDSSQSIYFSKPVLVRLPAPGKSVGDSVKIYYGQTLSSWKFHTTATVVTIGGSPYVEFTTNHATYFAIGNDTGLFSINNDSPSTTTQNVSLTINAPGATQMRFSNDNSNRSSWESYSTTKSWTLSDGAGTKIVYVQFDTNSDNISDASTSDSIEYGQISGGNNGQLRLEILGGTSECIYGTSLNLGAQTAKINSDYSFSGTFAHDWYCMDYKGVASGRAFTIQTSDLTGTNGGIISGSNVRISHNIPFAEGAGCTGDIGSPSQFYNSGFALMEKVIGYNNICKVTLSNVGLQINVPANTAPGDYQGILTMTLPNGF